MTETLIVNLFGAPGSGKSTGVAYIFSQLKMRGINAELVTEFAKDKVWEDNKEVFKNQAYIFGKQSYKINRVCGKADVIVTDSPIPLSILYNNDPILSQSFNDVVMNVFNSHNNLNFLLKRVKPYNPSGRLQTEKESDALFDSFVELLEDNTIPFKYANGDINGYENIISEIMKKI